jgi:hypothetical protein
MKIAVKLIVYILTFLFLCVFLLGLYIYFGAESRPMYVYDFQVTNQTNASITVKVNRNNPFIIENRNNPFIIEKDSTHIVERTYGSDSSYDPLTDFTFEIDNEFPARSFLLSKTKWNKFEKQVYTHILKLYQVSITTQDFEPK